jgi:hypothetical protein
MCNNRIKFIFDYIKINHQIFHLEFTTVRVEIGCFTYLPLEALLTFQGMAPLLYQNAYGCWCSHSHGKRLRWRPLDGTAEASYCGRGRGDGLSQTTATRFPTFTQRAVRFSGGFFCRCIIICVCVCECVIVSVCCLCN